MLKRTAAADLAAILTGVLLLPGWTGAQTPVGTAFTYQGRLNTSGTPASGPHDFEFGLYDADTGGSQVDTTVSLTANVTGGLFSAGLDFGPSAFSGSRRWLEISVRPSGGGAFTALLPRNEITAAPHAQFADRASTASNALEADSAENADTLDGVDSTGFATASHAHDRIVSGSRTLKIDTLGSIVGGT